MERIRTAIRAIVRAPAAHFLVLGALLFAVTSAATARTPAERRREPIVITAARIAELRDDYLRTFKRQPTGEEQRALVQRAADEEMLYREALVLGLDRGDRAIGWRILDKMHFLYGDEAGSPAEAYKRGVELGLKKDDAVVRNALITKMQLLGKAASRADEPSGEALERALEDYRRRHSATFIQPEQLTLTHVFFGRSRHGDAIGDRAAVTLARLRDANMTPEAATRLSDPFPAGLRLRQTSRTGLVKLFGEEFAAAVAGLEIGRWSGPLPSAYGVHLVLVEERTEAAAATLDEIRSRALRGYRAERHKAYLETMMAQLREAYEVRVESDAMASN